MTKLICDKKNFDLNTVKHGEFYPVWVFSEAWQTPGVEARRLLRSIELKPKMGLANGRESEFYPYKSATELKKLFKEKTDSRESTVDKLVTSMARKDKKAPVKSKPRKYKKRAVSKNNNSLPVNSIQSGIGFALEEAKILGCDPKEYVQSVEKAIASGHFQTT